MDYKVPYALNVAGDLISVNEAKKEEKYFCIECGSELIYKAGDIREKHFAHKVDLNCSIESVIHKIAKKLIVQIIKRNLDNKQEIHLNIKCDNCDKPHKITIKAGVFSGAQEEVQISKYRCDAVGYREGKPSLAIEIFNSHKVDNKKAENLSIPWIELDATDVINNLSDWNPINYKLKVNLCQSCDLRSEKIKSICNKWKIDSSSYTTIKKRNTLTYVAEIYRCFQCKAEIPVFWWKDVPFAQQKLNTNSPWTIQKKYSEKYEGEYYGNTCPKCRSLQGDNFVFGNLGKESPFAKLMNEDELSGSNQFFEIKSKKDINKAVNKMFGGFKI